MNFSDLIKGVNGAADGTFGYMKQEKRMELLQACGNLKRALESPLATTSQIIFGVRYTDVVFSETMKVLPDNHC